MHQPVQRRSGRRDGSPPRVPIAFHLTGRRSADDLDAIEPHGLQPALFAGYRDLTALRYDFPLVLVRGLDGQTRVQSLSGLFDAALGQISDSPDGDRLRRHALRMEREIRALSAGGAARSLSDLWMSAAGRIAACDDEPLRSSVRHLRCALPADAEVVDCDRAMPFRLCRHVWQQAHDEKAQRFRANAKKLVLRLSEILRADFERSEPGLSPGRLRASVGTTHQDSFDFDRLSGLLLGASREAPLAQDRRQRIEWLLFVLTSQRFFPVTDETGDAATTPYGFVFSRLDDAVAAYHERLPALVELAKALAMAELEISGRYDEAKHDDFFAEFGADDLDGADLDQFPDYLIHVHARTLSAMDGETVVDALSTGLRAKVLVQIDDILAPSPAPGRRLSIDGRSRHLANVAIGAGMGYVLQAGAASLFRLRDQIQRGMTSSGPALFVVFSGAPGTVGELPPYLVAAAATESRAFPSFAYDPSAGSDWASRFQLLDNPQPEVDWPVHALSLEDEAHQRIDEPVAFTLADFVACDRRYADHFALLPRPRWSGNLVPMATFLAGGPGVDGKVPYLAMVDRQNRVHKVIVDDKLVRETGRCAEMWHSLRELGGIHNSHAERLLAEERKTWAAQAPASPAAGANGHDASATVATVPAVAPAAAEPAPAVTSDDPYIETPRCTTCNECTQINDKMFAYDANKQAFIANPDAGTYRQLVEAAESCQVAIIHPGKPRNPNESGLDELIKRAEPFL